jgi:murein DD-endopeptidase MepM/ murein hydrolase activator NlpD
MTRRAILLAVLALGVTSAANAAPALGSLPPPVTPACISSPFGPRRLVGPHAATFHNGIDFPAPAGAWVRAVADGEIVAVRRLGTSGLEIDLLHHDPGGTFVTRYAHLGTVSPEVEMGRRVFAEGERIGRVGRTGITYGTHVHFELHLDGKPVDPEPYFTVPRCGGAPVTGGGE